MYEIMTTEGVISVVSRLLLNAFDIGPFIESQTEIIGIWRINKFGDISIMASLSDGMTE